MYFYVKYKIVASYEDGGIGEAFTFGLEHFEWMVQGPYLGELSYTQRWGITAC
jgi:hypothetical protein